VLKTRISAKYYIFPKNQYQPMQELDRAMNIARRIYSLGVAILLTACSTVSPSNDPYESTNRMIFNLNDKVDAWVFRPVAEVYESDTPQWLRTGVGNFFDNLQDVDTACNNALQARFSDAASDAARVALNSTVGIGGLINVASGTGLPKHRQDFGQTLGRWGVGAGPYLVLPLIGPSSMRDTLALAVDIRLNPMAYVYPVSSRNLGTALNLVDTRAYLLSVSSLLDDAALDKYEFTRSAYRQRRENSIYRSDQ